MTIAKSKTSSSAVSSAARRKSGSQPASHRSSRSATAANLSKRLSPQPATKQTRVLAMLHSTDGTTIAAMMKETGWQQHSIRGFLAGVVRKRLKLNLQSDRAKEGRVYRVSEKRSSTRKRALTKRAT